MAMRDTETAAIQGNSSGSRLKRWIEQFSGKRYAQWVLFLVACIEGSIFPLPPDPLFITLSVGNPRKAFYFAGICVAGSVLGSFIGYAVGYAAFESFGRAMLSSFGILDTFSLASDMLRGHGMLALIISGFTPIPYALFTIASGMNQTLDFGTLVVGSIIGRTLRFGLLGGLLYYFGEPVKLFIEKHLTNLSIVILIVAVLMIAIVRWLV